MSAPLDLTGSSFGELIALERDGKKWLCRCSCGKEKLIRTCHLRSGATSSCGHLIVDATRKRCTKHGHKARSGGSLTYAIWSAMKTRCSNPNQPGWKSYGGRGITVCSRWQSFDSFLEDMGECPEGMSIERIDVNAGYNPENCAWLPEKRQPRNKRNTLWVEHQGEKKCLADWAEEIGMVYSTLYNRLYRYGWTVERAIGEL